jgi:hypothetical protein
VNNDTPVQVEKDKDKEEEGKNIELNITDNTTVKEKIG